MCHSCKHLKSEIPTMYMTLSRLYKLKLSIIDMLHEMAFSAAPALSFRTSSPHKRKVEISVKVGGGFRYNVLWSVHADSNSIYILDSPWKNPYVVFKLSLTPQDQDHRGKFLPTHRVMFRSIQTKMGPPRFEEKVDGVDTLEKVMVDYKGMLSEQLLEIEKEVKNEEDYHEEDSDENDYRLDHDEFIWLDESSQDTSTTGDSSEGLIITDCPVIIVDDDVIVLGD